MTSISLGFHLALLPNFTPLSVSCKNCPSAIYETAVNLVCTDAAISNKQIVTLQQILLLYFVHSSYSFELGYL